jgi:hypothetical protein
LNSRKDQGRVTVQCADLKGQDAINRIDQLGCNVKNVTV